MSKCMIVWVPFYVIHHCDSKMCPYSGGCRIFKWFEHSQYCQRQMWSDSFPPTGSSTLPSWQSCDSHRNRPRHHVTAAGRETRLCFYQAPEHLDQLPKQIMSITPACERLDFEGIEESLSITSKKLISGMEKVGNKGELYSGFLRVKHIQNCTRIITLWRSQTRPLPPPKNLETKLYFSSYRTKTVAFFLFVCFCVFWKVYIRLFSRMLESW